MTVQRWAKKCSLGCVNPASWLPLAAGHEFTQPRANLLADPCTIYCIVLSAGPWTVFAPTNDAFANMDPDTIDALSNNDALLERVLKYHIVPEGKIFTRIVKDNLLAPSLEGTDLRFNKNDGAGVITINGAELVPDKSDQRAANGVVHFLNDVIYPLPVGSLYDTLDDDSR